MSLSMANIEGLELVEIMDAVRTQEYIHISFYSVYVYYVLATLPEEIAIIIPHKRNLGKGLFFVIRYGMCTYIALHFTRGYRNYYHISAQSCKTLGIVQHFIYWLVDLSCSLSLGLCLGALLRASRLCAFPIFFLCATPPLIDIVYVMSNDLRYPAHSVSPPAGELGYPCFIPSDEQWSGDAASQIGNDIRSYLRLTATISSSNFTRLTLLAGIQNSCMTTVLLIVALLVFFIDYKRQKGRLIQVMRRDAGLCYLTVTGVRLLAAILNAPAIATARTNHQSYAPIPLLLTMVNDVAIPALTQRLMINIRKSDSSESYSSGSGIIFASMQSDPSETLSRRNSTSTMYLVPGTISETSSSVRAT